VPTPTPTLGPLVIAGVEPTIPTCRQALTVRGKNFGSSQKAVDGDLTIDAVQTAIINWSDSAIQVTVPATVRAGPERSVEVTVAGKRAMLLVRINC